MQLASIPGKLTVAWNAEVRAVVDTWTNYGVTLEEFKQAILGKAVSQAKMNNVRAWIVDSSKANGTFSQEIQDFIGTDIFPAFAKAGVKYFITITSASAVTRMTIRNYTAKLGPNGLKLVDVASVEDAIEWLKKN